MGLPDQTQMLDFVCSVCVYGWGSAGEALCGCSTPCPPCPTRLPKEHSPSGLGQGFPHMLILRIIEETSSKSRLPKPTTWKVSFATFPVTEQVGEGALGPEGALLVLPRATAASLPLLREFSKQIGMTIIFRCSEVIKAVASLLKMYFLVAHTSFY